MIKLEVHKNDNSKQFYFSICFTPDGKATYSIGTSKYYKSRESAIKSLAATCKYFKKAKFVKNEESLLDSVKMIVKSGNGIVVFESKAFCEGDLFVKETYEDIVDQLGKRPLIYTHDKQEYILIPGQLPGPGQLHGLHV